MKTNLLLVLLLSISISAFSQDKQTVNKKKIEKAEKFIKSEKYEEAEEIYEELANEHKTIPELWNRLIDIQFMVYKDKLKYDDMFSNIKITTKSEDGKELKDDSLANNLMSLFKDIKVSDNYLNDHLLYSCRKACIYTDKAYSPCVMLRSFMIDQNTNLTVMKEAQRYFNLGESEFQQQNYKKAIEFYKKALAADGSFYKAQLYLGDSYYMLEDYESAVREFKLCVQTKPTELEPRKYLADAYYKIGNIEKSYETCKEGYLLYPDFSMKDKYEDICTAKGMSTDMHWMPRSVLPNQIAKKQEGKLTHASNEDELKSRKDVKDSWRFYVEAFEQIKSFCDESGLIKEGNGITKEKYAEVYCWDYMLSKAPATEFPFVRKMKEAGYLNCYALLSCFHQDFYDQYKHFVENNAGQVDAYLKFLALQK